MGTGMLGVGGQQHPHISLPSTHVQYHLVPGGLVDFIHFTADDRSPQFSSYGSQTDCVQWHVRYSSIIRVNSSLSRSVSPRRYSQPNNASSAVAV